ncbi:DUF2200 domain-containing protein [Flavobacterium branchiophilum]|uniref:DUF2200 domain-containing protein n=1 Tax=Flavobacterium branchiophilum (strain FL-15) TaxID=1034807 RepID=G2Z1Q0_FLABF|nr:DUF2200 domain-containing protein [Flavobacterium branchiophilum]CCB69831.1 Hypothetical protein FBFL15_1774 [Flavobacterium branchiophilum FL-15]
MVDLKKQEERIAKMTFAKVYPLYVAKIEKKNQTKKDLDHIITWLTGFDENCIQQHVKNNINFETFFDHAVLNPNAKLIKGVICGYRIEDIASPLVQKVRYLDKLVDELAKGKSLDKILRK